MSKFIIVLGDGETWETLNDCIEILEVTNDAYIEICDGDKPENLTPEDVLNRVSLSTIMEQVSVYPDESFRK